jgi:hypothetical protein
MKVRTVHPSSSYHLQLPIEVEEQHDSSASSFWIRDEPLLLQLSSYIRETGDQVSAEDHLASRMQKHEGMWRSVPAKQCPSLRCDQASAELTDEDGLMWFHTYLVWPHLSVYATVSGPEALVRDASNWALRALDHIEMTAS